MNCLVLREEIGGEKIELYPDMINEISFGEVEVNERSIRNVYIVNSGKFNFDYNWTTPSRYPVSVKPCSGGIMFGERQCCQILFCPTDTMEFVGERCKMTLQVIIMQYCYSKILTTIIEIVYSE